MFPGYLRMVEYSYRWLGGFLHEPEPRDTVLVLVGDHQPAANVSGEGAPWDVPVHIVARDAELLARFTALGFHPGLEPPRATAWWAARPDGDSSSPPSPRRDPRP